MPKDATTGRSPREPLQGAEVVRIQVRTEYLRITGTASRRRWASVRRRAPPVQVLLDDAVLFPQILDDLKLVAIHQPARVTIRIRSGTASNTDRVYLYGPPPRPPEPSAEFSDGTPSGTVNSVVRYRCMPSISIRIVWLSQLTYFFRLRV